MTKARDTANIVGGGFSGTIAGATMEPTGDTSSSDNAAIGYTAAEGLILTGQGSTGDVTIKNDADGLVAHVPTGTTGVTFAGTPIFPDGSIAIADLDIDGGTDIGAAIVDADLMIVDDAAGGTNRKATMTRLSTYMATKIGGGMVFLASSGAVSGVASISFTQFDATKYDHYNFYFQHIIPATDDVSMLAHVSTDGGSSYDTTNGNYHILGTTDITGFEVTDSGGYTVGSASNEFGISGEFNLFAPHNSSAYTYAHSDVIYMYSGGTNHVYSSQQAAYGGTIHLVAADVDAIKFIFSSGNVESGEITMFGVVNS